MSVKRTWFCATTHLASSAGPPASRTLLAFCFGTGSCDCKSISVTFSHDEQQVRALSDLQWASDRQSCSDVRRIRNVVFGSIWCTVLVMGILSLECFVGDILKQSLFWGLGAFSASPTRWRLSLNDNTSVFSLDSRLVFTGAK